MKRTLLSIALALTTFLTMAQTGLKKVYDENINPMTQIDEAVAKASSSEKFVICQVGGNWCPWCLRFADFISKDADIMKVITENFIYAHINYNPTKSKGADQAEAAVALMNRLGNPQRFGFPVFVVLDQNGKVLHIQDSSFLEEGKGYNKDKVLRFLNAWTPKAVGKQTLEAADNEVIKNIMLRRSVRKYLDKPVEHEKLNQIAMCGIHAPNGMNSQQWAVRIVEDYGWIEATTEIFKKSRPEMVSRDKNFKNMFRNAPNLICVATPGGQQTLDAGMLGENIMLAATSLGLGTCCLGGPVNFLVNNEDCRPYLEQLHLPEGYKLCYIIAIGYPDEQPQAKPRDESKIQFVSKSNR